MMPPRGNRETYGAGAGMEAGGDSRAEAFGGTRTQALKRLQLGVAGLVAMLLLVALASTIMEQARDAEDPQVAAGQPDAKAEAANDPLVDIGVAPELPQGEGPEAMEGRVPDLPMQSMPPAEQAGAVSDAQDGATQPLEQ